MEKTTKNIIITTVNPYMRKDKYEFFFFENELGECKYCGSLSDQEAGTKLILSNNDIDEIIVIGKAECVNDERNVDRISLKQEYSLYKSDISKLKAFDMFAYRLAQFLDDTDIELFELEESLRDYKKVFDDLFVEIKKEFPQAEKNKLFHYIRLFETGKEIPLLSLENRKETAKILSVAYQNLDSYYKMKPLLCNDDLLMSFIPADFNSDSRTLIKELLYRFEEIVNSKQYDNINVYLDTQGLNQAESLTVLYSMMMLANENSIIRIKTFITANPSHNFLIRKIYDSVSTLDMNYLSTGISDFIEYGKVDNIEKYWKTTKKGSVFIDSFVNAMKTIDIGISLCNFYELEKGIKKIKKLLKNTNKNDELNLSRGLFVLLIYGIMKDYGDLINSESDEIDVFEVIKWAYKKKYYQQAITFVESQIPHDIVKRGIWYYAKDEDDYQNVLQLLTNEYKLSPPHQRYAFDDVSHYLLKIEGRKKLGRIKDNYEKQQVYAKYKVSLLDDNPENPYKAYSLIEDKETILSALFAYYVLSTKRNLINHAQKTFDIDSEMEMDGECAIYNDIEKTLSYFIDKYQLAVDALKGKTFESRIITTQEITDSYNIDKKNNPKKIYQKNKVFKECRYCILSPEGKKYNYNNLEEWITRFADKHPELMEEELEIVTKKLIETKDTYLQNKTIISYKGYRLLPTSFDSKTNSK